MTTLKLALSRGMTLYRKSSEWIKGANNILPQRYIIYAVHAVNLTKQLVTIHTRETLHCARAIELALRGSCLCQPEGKKGGCHGATCAKYAYNTSSLLME